MKASGNVFLCPIGLLGLCAPAFAAVTVTSLTPSLASPQNAGSAITWTATAIDTGAGQFTFQFLVAFGSGKFVMVKDFNVGTLSGGIWTSQPFVWVPTGIAGTYTIKVVAKDFNSPANMAAKDAKFTVQALATTSPVVVSTANPLVALFAAPACPGGSNQRVAFQKFGSTAVNVTNYVKCNANAALNYEIAGMYANTTYNMYTETETGGTITNGPMVSFTTGALPTDVPFPTFTITTAGGDGTSPLLLLGPVAFGPTTAYPLLATDRRANVLWYYYDPVSPNYTLLTRPLAQNVNFSYPTMLVFQDGVAWDSSVTLEQYLRQLDLAGNVVKETNVGVIQQELLALGANDAGPCSVIPKPAPVGSACLGSFHHEAIQTLPGGQTALIASIETARNSPKRSLTRCFAPPSA